MITSEIGERIREHRQKKGYSQQYMATKLKLAQTTYCHIENGKVAKVDPHLYDEIAALLEIDVTKLLFPPHKSVFYNCQQSGEIGVINNQSAETTAFLKIISAQLEALNTQMALMNKYLSGE